MSLELKEKKIFVTGGSRGIGKGIVEALAREGASVAFSYTGSSPESEEKMRQYCENCSQKTGSQVSAYKLNLGNTEDFSALSKTLKEKWGVLDGLVNNAGIAVDQLLLRYKSEDLDKMLDVNLKGTILLTKELMRLLMKSTGPASIVNMSSVVAGMGNAGQSVYAATKAGLIGFSKSLAREMASKKMRVNVIAPGFIQTDMTDQIGAQQQEAFLSSIPLGEMGQVEDIAGGVLYLMSPMSRYVTGQILNINGGLYM